MPVTSIKDLFGTKISRCVQGGSVAVPYMSILKVDVMAGRLMSRADEVIVALRSGEALRGHVEKAEVTIECMGYMRRFRLHDLKQVCPASTYFGEVSA